MFSARRLHHTYEDYLTFEAASATKHEYCDGEIYAMAGGTLEHGALIAAVTAALRRQLPATCHVLSSDVRLRIQASDLSTYPDVSVVCGKPIRDERDTIAMTNPTLLVEVTSPSSKDYDRGEKLSHYKQLPSLRAVIIVAYDAKRITVVERGATGWTLTEFRSGEVAHVAEPHVQLAVDELYAVLEGL
jgi:Uma2 family endonuclease